jgi:hypothetical protein
MVERKEGRKRTETIMRTENKESNSKKPSWGLLLM